MINGKVHAPWTKFELQVTVTIQYGYKIRSTSQDVKSLNEFEALKVHGTVGGV